MPGSGKPSVRSLIVAEPPARYALRQPLVVDCSLISEALAQPDGTWVTLTSKVVTGGFTYGNTEGGKPVRFFLENDFVTGVCLPVDGGFSVYGF